MVKVVQVLLFILLQILFIPFLIIGLLVALYKEMYLSKKYEVSFSAGQSLQYRWIMHYFDTRPDLNSVKFTKAYPCESHFGLFGFMGAFILAQRWFGFKTNKLSVLVEDGKETIDAASGKRVIRFDEIMEKYIDQVEQIVLPGAGYDLIALKYTKNTSLKVFEIDQTKTMNLKVRTLKKAQIDHDWITYIPIDYNKESWVDKLIDAGYDPTKKTLFLWQTVSLYLDEELVKETLIKMSEISAKGSIIAQDFYSTAFMSGDISKVATKQMNLIASLGEPWKFTIDMSENPHQAVADFLQECNLTLDNYIQFGEKLGLKPYYCITESIKK